MRNYGKCREKVLALLAAIHYTYQLFKFFIIPFPYLPKESGNETMLMFTLETEPAHSNVPTYTNSFQCTKPKLCYSYQKPSAKIPEMYTKCMFLGNASIPTLINPQAKHL